VLFFYPGIRDGKNPDSGSGMNILDHFSESLKQILGFKKILKFFDADPNLGDPGSGI
jgi:hypothetical protein